MATFQNKIKSKAMQIHKESVNSLEYTIKFPARKKIGITFRRHNEWGVVKVVPAGSEIIIGSLLAAVNGKSVLLMKFDDAIQKAAEALTSGKPFEVTFMAPYRLEGLMKKYETRRMGSGWKTYYFQLNSGILQCFVKRQGRLKYEWDLSNETMNQTLITLAPKALLEANEMGVMVVKGGEKVILKADDNGRSQTWGAFLYLSIVVANGGNPDMYALEAKRIKEKTGAEADMTALLEQAEKAELEVAAKAAAAEKKAKADAEEKVKEAARLLQLAAEAADGEARAAAEEEAKAAADAAAKAQEEEEAALLVKASTAKKSRRASMTMAVAAAAAPLPEPQVAAAEVAKEEEEEEEEEEEAAAAAAPAAVEEAEEMDVFVVEEEEEAAVEAEMAVEDESDAAQPDIAAASPPPRLPRRLKPWKSLLLLLLCRQPP